MPMWHANAAIEATCPMKIMNEILKLIEDALPLLSDRPKFKFKFIFPQAV